MIQLVKNLPAVQETWVQSLDQEDSLEMGMQPTPVFLPEEFHGQRSLAGYFCIHSASLCLLVGAFNPFTFKVITAKYDPVAIYFIVLGSSLYTVFCFLSREYPLVFVGELVWWC